MSIINIARKDYRYPVYFIMYLREAQLTGLRFTYRISRENRILTVQTGLMALEEWLPPPQAAGGGTQEMGRLS